MQLPTPAHTPTASYSSSLESGFENWESKLGFDKLSPELCSIIFTHLRDLDWRSAHICRLVSRPFEAWATPVFYNKVEVNEKILDEIQDKPSSVARLISTHTRHLVVRSHLDPDKVQRLLVLATHLQSFQWLNGDDSQAGQNAHGAWPPPTVLDHIPPGTKLLLENVPLRFPNDTLLRKHIKQLHSMRIAGGHPKLSRWLTPLKRMLLQATKLETFHYQDNGYGCSFELTDGERLPPIKNLHLKSYRWQHTRDQVDEHWDFARVRCLCLTDVPMYGFLRSISMTDFANLHTLTINCHSVYPDEEEGRTATKLLATLIGTHVRALTSLDITCDVGRFPLDSIVRHKNSLQCLRVRDFIGFEDDDGLPCPTLLVGDVLTLARELTHVRTLELDMDTRVCDAVEFVQAVAGFRNLRELTMHTQAVKAQPSSITVLDDEDGLVRTDAQASHDAALQTAIGLLNRLLETDAELSRRQEGHERILLLRRVTVNIGGWRLVSLRRITNPWRQRNEPGNFAERCFVLERPALHSCFPVTELVAVGPRVSSVPLRATDLDDVIATAMTVGVC